MVNRFNVKPLIKIVKTEIRERIEKCNKKPSLALLLGKEEPDAIYYAHSIIKKGEKLGVYVKLFSYKNKEEYYNLIEDETKNFYGILALSPYSNDVNNEDIESIPLQKDVDCFNTYHLGKLFRGQSDFAPATASSALEIAKYQFNNSLKGKDVVVVGRSLRVGKPLIPLFLKENATVTICHSKTQKLSEKIKRSDIVVCAIGRGQFFKSSMFRSGQFIIDVGINKMEDKFYGDVDEEDLIKNNLDVTITPVPGGVGSLTSYLIFKNLLYLMEFMKG